MKFYQPTKGSILLDGVDLNNINRSDLKGIFGMVLQDTWLFSGTIMENIRYGKIDATDEEVKQAAITANINHYIMTQPDTYNMILNEETNTDLIDMKEEITYDNEYEEQILKHDEDEKYKIIELEVNGQKGYLAAIYDPSMVKVSVTKSLGVKGQLVTKMAEDNKAILSVNGGGFYDPGHCYDNCRY